MPDWIVHIGVAYIICRLLYTKYTTFNHSNTILVMVGSLIPDIAKLAMITEYLGMDTLDYFMAFHQPLTSLIVAAILCLFFEKRKIVLGLLILGLATHYALDLLLINFGGGIYIFFPLSWQIFFLFFISSDDYYLSLIILLLAFLFFIVDYWRKDAKID